MLSMRTFTKSPFYNFTLQKYKKIQKTTGAGIPIMRNPGGLLDDFK